MTLANNKKWANHKAEQNTSSRRKAGEKGITIVFTLRCNFRLVENMATKLQSANHQVKKFWWQTKNFHKTRAKRDSEIKDTDWVTEEKSKEKVLFYEPNWLVCSLPVFGVMISSNGLLASTSICKGLANCDKDQTLTVESREHDAIVKGLNLWQVKPASQRRL